MTIGWLAHLYPWTKAIHIIAIIAWMAGLLYLPRLYVYHCETAAGSEASERFKIMERKLYKQIMTPAMLTTFAFGIVLALTPGLVDWHQGWFHVKLVAVLLLAAFRARWASGGANSCMTGAPGRRNSSGSPMRCRRC